MLKTYYDTLKGTRLLLIISTILAIGLIKLHIMDQQLLHSLIASAKQVFPDNIVMQAVVVTQAIHESHMDSQRGMSQLALRYNNLFGIKGLGPTGEGATMPTWEHVNGKDIHTDATFAVYEDHIQCFQAYKKLISHDRYRSVLNADNPYDAFDALRADGYATDPAYPDRLKETFDSIVKPEFE